MRSASTANRPAANAVLLFIVLSILSACAAPRIIRETPTAGTSASPTVLPTATLPSASPTLSATPEESGFKVDRVAFATRIDDSNAPIVETTVVSERARRIFLCVHVTGIRPGAPFRAYWMENDQIIGQSDAIAIETKGRPTWVALEYNPPFQLKPDADYAVELLIDDQKIDRYMFRAGKGDPTKAIAAAAFASGFDAAGKPTGVRTRFPADATELTFRVRVSRMVEPADWTFMTLWFRDDVLIAQVAPDPGDDPRLLAFTLRPSGELPPGPYSVTLLLNGIDASTVQFTVSEAGSAPDLPAGSPTAAVGTTASISRIVLTDRVDPRTNAPAGDEITVWDATERSATELWLAIDVSQLTRDDVLEVRLHQTGTIFSNKRLPRRAVDAGWVATPVNMAVPTVRDGPVEYTITVLLNGNRTETWTVLINPVAR